MLKQLTEILLDWDYPTALQFFLQHGEDGYTKTYLSSGSSSFHQRMLRSKLEELQHNLRVTLSTPGPSLDTSQPTSVKELIQEKNKLYKECLSIKGSLLEIEDSGKRNAVGHGLMDKWEQLYEIWDRLDAYQETGELPRAKDDIDYSSFKDMSLRKIMQLKENNRTYIRRFKGDATKADKVAEREKELQSIEHFLDNATIQ